MSARSWDRSELLAAFHLYCRTPFGRLHRRNPDVVALAQVLDRTPSAVAMKLCNFASLDPVQGERKVAGLRNASRADREIWEAFSADPEGVAVESYECIQRAGGLPSADAFVDGTELVAAPEVTEALRETSVRLVQGFFRTAVLASYGAACAMCDVSAPELVNASHIVPWRVDRRRRADPRNGLALCVLHDRAFDRGLVGLDTALRIMVSPRLRATAGGTVCEVAFLDREGMSIRLPTRFAPDPGAVAYHREAVFQKCHPRDAT